MFSNEYVCQELVRQREARYQAEALGDYNARLATEGRPGGRGGWIGSLRKWMAIRTGEKRPCLTTTKCEPLSAKS